MSFKIGKELGNGGFGIVFPVEDTNLVVKAMEFAKHKNLIKKEIMTMKSKTNTLSFCLPLCDYKPIIDQNEIKGILLFLPRAKGDLYTVGEEYSEYFEKTKLPKEKVSFGTACKNLITCHKTKPKTTLEFEKMFHFITQMAVGLEEFHSTGLVHRDIKEPNYLVFNQTSMQLEQHSLVDKQMYDKVVLADFGLAIESTEVKSGRGGGTRIYAPYFDYVEKDKEGDYEWKKGYTVSQKFDVYSLGITIFRLLNNDVFSDSLYTIKSSIMGDFDAENFVFKNYKPFIKALKSNLENQRKNFQIPEKQVKLENYLIEKVLVLEKNRHTSSQVAKFLMEINKEQYQDVVENYKRRLECDSVP